MTRDEILTQIADIRFNADDDEIAHIYEDNLRRDFIAWLADGAAGSWLVDGAEIVELARLILSTEEMDFARWCA